MDDVPQERCLNSEEPLVLHTDLNNNTLHIANTLPNLQMNDNPCVTADNNCDVGQLSDIAVPAGTGGPGDDLIHTSAEPETGRAEGVHSVSQDEDVEPNVFDRVTHELH